MNAYKFLHAGGLSTFSGFSWPLPDGGVAGAWVATEDERARWSSGIHACDAGGLVDWIDDELWIIELEDAVSASEGVLVGRRGRLVQRVNEWSPGAARELGEACVWRFRDRVVEALNRNGLEADADRIARTADLDELQRSAVDNGSDEDEVRSGLAYLRDVVELSRGGRPDTCRGATAEDAGPGAITANLAYVSAVAAGALDATRTGDATSFATTFDSERAWQRQWLHDRLALSEQSG